MWAVSQLLVFQSSSSNPKAAAAGVHHCGTVGVGVGVGGGGVTMGATPKEADAGVHPPADDVVLVNPNDAPAGVHRPGVAVPG